MGFRHRAYCVGCCWVLMSLLFVAGVMNLLWIAVITVFVLVEKVLPRGDVVGRLTASEPASQELAFKRHLRRPLHVRRGCRWESDILVNLMQCQHAIN